jgi:quinolinate synthase
VVFCGVHFMAESADLLTEPEVRVILPNMAAGCSMADMADPDDVFACWDDLTELLGDDIVPVTYMNSAASLKAFCGEHGGIVCTSSNAPKVLQWAYERGSRVLFFPDEHLGRNTGVKLGIGLDEMAVWNYRLPDGGASEESLRRSKLVLWQGYCTTHQRFNVRQIEQARAANPKVNIVVHPECRYEVVQAADYDGSTEVIIKTVNAAAPGTSWGVGTEINLVNRLARANPDKEVFCLDPVVCPCSTMYRIHPAYLAWVLEGLVAGHVVNEIRVDDETRHWARTALERMLAVA